MFVLELGPELLLTLPLELLLVNAESPPITLLLLLTPLIDDDNEDIQDVDTLETFAFTFEKPARVDVANPPRVCAKSCCCSEIDVDVIKLFVTSESDMS